MTKVGFRVAHVLGNSNAVVWQVLGDFGTEHRWTRSLAHWERNTVGVDVGTVRTCTLPRPLMGRTQVNEQLIEYEPLKALTYELDGAAGPFASAQSRWSTHACADDTTELVVEGRFEVRSWFSRRFIWPIARPMLERLTTQVIRELEVYLRARPFAATS